jgi:hydroxymethylpyrimidine kinase/phosphomethylpyrimidine kinase
MNAVLSIAGSDSGGGAGIQADLKTFEAHSCFGLTAITAVTAQNTVAVRAVQATSARMLRAQLDAVADDFDFQAIKIGMLANAALVRVVAVWLRQLRAPVPVVLDPVMVATSGHSLLQPAAVARIRAELMPLATVTTPNVPEAELLLADARSIRSIAEAKQAAQELGTYTQGYVLLKAAHLLEDTDVNTENALAKDILYHNGEFHVFAEPFLRVGKLHGTGCTLSSAIAANLANGYTVQRAVRDAKEYVTNAILLAPKHMGRGSKPLRHNQQTMPQ